MNSEEKKVMRGLMLMVAGIIWLLIDLGILEWRHFIPTVLIAIGLLLIVKGLWRGGEREA